MTSHVFTYGSLMFGQIWRRVVRGEYASTPATARDNARYAIRGETYPGMVRQTGASVEGVLYLDVGPDDLVALDRFEGSEYRRESILLTLADGTMLQGEAYLYLAAEKLSESPWLPEDFQMERFIGTYCREKPGS